jgi:hypothetical protein
MRIHKILTYIIALVWLANGLLCKVLNMVPRHEQIVARILGDEYAPVLIKLIGVSEIAMAVWVFSGIKSRWNAIAQIVIIATMNSMEFILASDLLLWGQLNAAFAFLFIVVIYFNEFYIKRVSIIQ